MSKPKVAVLSLGGTIAMTQSGQGGVVPTLTGEMLVAAVPALQDLADIQALSFRQKPGAHLSFDDLEALAQEIGKQLAAGACGVVVTQGTDTLEETAFTLDRLLGGEAPVVVTGAMRNPTLPGADGPANLLAAVQVVLSEAARGLGCLVVMNDEIHAARFVRKAHTGSPAAFSSPVAGPIGWVAEGRVRIPLRLEPIPSLPWEPDGEEAPVALITVGLGDDGALIDAACNAGFKGIVAEATGGGHVAPAVAEALERAARQMPVILASRTGAGEVLCRTYGFPGSEIDLQRRGLIRAGWLDGLKAKVLLTLLLRHADGSPQSVSAAFQPWGGGAQGM
ncbi:asparaginase [Telmatospirillum sp. J64-1]|uniref:asparaginase n=1 Tax=Telmatospirillum sp. J64-1 TaxID=2502183 RepID=UPI00115C4739|nr:asparaginase [Telmatospirillum sp. J64-1]